MKEILKQAEKLVSKIEQLGLDSKVDTINRIKLMIHKVSPMSTEPVDCVLWVKNETVFANDYNPNSVAPPEMKLLEHSISEDGYTQPIVTFRNEEGREVVDGFHRHRVGKESIIIQSRIHGYLPVEQSMNIEPIKVIEWQLQLDITEQEENIK